MQLIKRKKITLEEKQRLVKRIKKFLEKEKTILFAYIYGSFAEGTKFNDIDIAIFFDEKQFPEKNKIFNYSLKLCSEIENNTGNHYQVEIHPLNLAPLSFRFAVITDGKLLIAREDDSRVDFEVRTRDLYFDFQPHFEYYYRTVVLGENI